MEHLIVSGVSHFDLQIGHRGEMSSVEVGSDPSSTCFLSIVSSSLGVMYKTGLLHQADFPTVL